MAIDKLVDSTQLDSDLASVADAIRAKSGGSSELDFPSEFVSEIESIPTGGSPTGTKQISINQNGTTTENVADYASAEINVNVPASAVDSGTKSISSNGTHDVTGYASASVAVPNSYASGDEGKVVSNGALVAQTSDTVTENDTYDTTLINSLTVNVSGGGGGSQLTKLDEIITTEAVRSFAITPDSEWWDYDYLLFKFELVFSSNDYLYISTSATSGGQYTNSRANYNAIGWACHENVRLSLASQNLGGRVQFTTTDTLYLYMYNANNTILSGGKITIYGGMLSDL